MTTSMAPASRKKPAGATIDLGALVMKMMASQGSTAMTGGLGRGLQEAADADPLGTLAKTVAAASTVFYLAERGKNPKVKSLHDALVLITTSLSVGCTDIFPRTKVGKLVTSFVMAIGPGLSSRALEHPDGPPEARAIEELVASQKELSQKLERLVRALETGAQR